MTLPKSDDGIVVLGAPRSDTTLLRRILNAHPRIASPGEKCILSACARLLHSETVADGLDFGVISGLSFAGYAKKQGKQRWAEKTAVDIFHLDETESLCADKVKYTCVARHGLDVVCSLRKFSDRGFTYLAEIRDYVKRCPRPLEAFAPAGSMPMLR